MEKTIFNTYVEITGGQEQCNRLKQICIDNNLPYWENSIAFELFKSDKNPVFCNLADEGSDDVSFFIDDLNDLDTDQPAFYYEDVTESEWLELLKEYKS